MRVVVVALALALAGCGPASESEAFDPSPHALPNLTIYFARSIPVAERFDVVDSMRTKQQSLATTITALMTAIHGVPPRLPTMRRVYVHGGRLVHDDRARGTTRAYWDLDDGNAIHCTRGDGREAPGFLGALTHSLYYPLETHEQAPTYLLNGVSRTLWEDVRDEEARVDSQIRFLRGIP